MTIKGKPYAIQQGPQAQDIDSNFDLLFRYVKELQADIESLSGGSSAAAHEILSTTHDDTTVAVPATGDLLDYEAGTWRRKAIGSLGQFLRVAAGVPTWSDLDTVIAGGSFGDATHVPVITVDNNGRVTAVVLVAISGVPAAAHNLLSATHGDTVAASPSLGDLVVGQAAAGSVEDSLDGWIDGEPGGFIQDSSDDWGIDGWIDGEPGGSLGAGSSSGSPSWQRLALGAANYFLRSTGTGVEWAPVNSSQFTAKAYLSSDVSVAYNTVTAISWAAVSWDTGGFWTISSPTRLTIPVGAAGYYIVLAQVQADIGFGSFNTQIYQNGTLVAQTQQGLDNIAAGVGDHEPKQAMALLSVAVGDYIEVKVILARTSLAPTTVQGGSAKTFCSLLKVA